MSNLQRMEMIRDATEFISFLNDVFNIRRSGQMIYKKITK
jgi:hypothetical protein